MGDYLYHANGLRTAAKQGSDGKPLTDVELYVKGPDNQKLPLKTDENGALEVNAQLMGSLTSQSTDPKPTGEEGWSLSEYNPDTGEVKFYKYIAGDWREI